MKRFLLPLLVAMLPFLSPKAQVMLDAEHFPDARLRAAIASFISVSVDSEIPAEKLSSTTRLQVENLITDLTGIEYFPNLTVLRCPNNKLTSIDLSGNPLIEELNCSNNQLTSIDFSGNTRLRQLVCDGNDALTSIHLSGCSGLQQLAFEVCRVSDLDLSGCTALSALYCGSNFLTSIDLSDCTALETLYCYGNQLSTLDLSANTQLSEIVADNNYITSITTSGLPAMEFLSCINNALRGSAVDNLIAALPTITHSEDFFFLTTTTNSHEMDDTILYPEGNVMTPTQVATARAKGWYPLYYGNNTDYDGTALLLDAEHFPDAVFRSALTGILGISEGSEITSEKIAATTSLMLGSRRIADLTGIEYFTSLTDLNCTNTDLTTLDLSGNTSLRKVSCGGCASLTSVNLSGCTGLSLLNAINCTISDINLSGCTALDSLWVEKNQISTLDLSDCTALTDLHCFVNRLTSLDLSANSQLKLLDCYDNYLTDLTLASPALRYLCCFGNALNGDVIDKIITALPTIPDGDTSEFYFIDKNVEGLPERYTESNEMTPAQVAAALAKGWDPLYFDDDADDYISYPGSSDEGSGLTVSVSDAPTAANAPTYDLLGRRTRPDARGILLRDGRKFLTR